MSLFPDRHQQLHAGGREVLDRYYTPDEVAAQLVEYLPSMPLGPRILEPSVGSGAWVRALRERWCDARIHGHDIDPDALGLRVCDSCTVGDFLDLEIGSVDAVVGNPPYRAAEAHVRHALKCAPVVAFLLRLAFLESRQRAPLWAEHPAAKVVVLSSRPSFTGGGTDSAAYALFVWDARHRGPTTLEVMS